MAKTPFMERSKKYLELVERIKLIDTKAARFLMTKKVQKINGFNPNYDSLLTIFTWNNSPQGQDYWSALHKFDHDIVMNHFTPEQIKKIKRERKLVKINKHVHPRVHLDIEVATFYLLQELTALLEGKTFAYPSQIKYVERLKTYQQEQADNLALAMRDYIVLASFGEARHGYSMMNSHVRIKAKLKMKNRSSREGCYQEGLQFEPIQMLKDLYRYFMSDRWESGFGGEPWAKACKYALDYQKIPSTIFIDNLVDLQHHNGSIFSKPCIFTYVYLDKIINLKAKGTTLFNPPLPPSLYITLTAYQLLQTFIEMKFIGRKITGSFISTQKISDFIELPWGSSRLEQDYLVPE